jgi:hypothetical protein
MHYGSDGRVTGHPALWQTCHTGFLNGGFAECVKAPRSQTEYGFFHLGSIETEEGEHVAVGKITYDTDHAPLTAGLHAASRHYDHTGSVGAFVRAVDGKFGPWLSGAVRSDIPPEGLRDLRANPPSGDWRSLDHSLEMIAVLAVPVPGFPVSRSQFSLAASADGEVEIEALILPGVWDEEPEAPEPKPLSRIEYLRERASLTAAVLTSKKRKRLSESSFAIPSRRAYPIHDRSHAANALARAAGKPEEATVRRAVCKRFPDMPSCR